MRQEKILGQYFTQVNIFKNKIFLDWVKSKIKNNEDILEPFAGKNGLIYMLQELNLIENNFKSFDISPGSSDIKKKDTIKNFPKGYSLCITNPPFLGKNVAGKFNLKELVNPYNDIYEKCIDLCLKNCSFVVAIVPVSFITTDMFKDRLEKVILLPYKKLFKETEHPVCLALWGNEKRNDFEIFNKEEKIGDYKKIKLDIDKYLNLDVNYNNRIEIYNNNGNFGLWAIDATDINKKMKFSYSIEMNELENNNKQRSRFIFNLINKDGKNYSKKENNIILIELNNVLNEYRKISKDIDLTAFKGLRQDNLFRRRMDFETARKIIAKTLYVIEKNNLLK